ncbi:Siphovirus Gp157 [uncultured Caudovirales phage]|uniref:Siphovirus Gp157 n=1 Tax=uncultured Caudovirales phage TaxID=2100421 RepID=A0A6J7W7Y8_9CAUD|nr:Siphovirus Gp157 [uncultured Caudovirales phage]
MNLYEISQELFEQLSAPGIDLETGEIDDAAYGARIDALALSFSDKALSVAKYIKSLEAERDAIKAAMVPMQDRVKRLDKRAEYLSEYLLSMCSQQDRWPSDAQVKLGARKSTSVRIDDETKIPAEYISQKVVESVDKRLIGQDLKAGKCVAGASLEEKQNLQIK